MRQSPGFYRLRPVLVALFLLIVSVTPALAYVNPGAGGMLVQLLIGGAITGVVLLRAYWQRFREWFSGQRSRHQGSGL